jgi:hypothetical protein
MASGAHEDVGDIPIAEQPANRHFARRMTEQREGRARPVLSVLALLIGIAAVIAFILLNRMMAPPFPRFNVSPTAGLYVTNNPAQSTNSSLTNK